MSVFACWCLLLHCIGDIFTIVNSGGSKGVWRGRLPPPIDWMHLKTSENFARKCIILAWNFQKFSGARPTPHHSAAYFKFLDPPLIVNAQLPVLLASRFADKHTCMIQTTAELNILSVCSAHCSFVKMLHYYFICSKLLFATVRLYALPSGILFWVFFSSTDEQSLTDKQQSWAFSMFIFCFCRHLQMQKSCRE